MDTNQLDLRVHESKGTFVGYVVYTFRIVHYNAPDPTHDPVATMYAHGANVDFVRELAHMFANAPDMQRSGEFHLPDKRYLNDSMFEGLKFREVTMDEFEASMVSAEAKAQMELEAAEHILDGNDLHMSLGDDSDVESDFN